MANIAFEKMTTESHACGKSTEVTDDVNKKANCVPIGVVPVSGVNTDTCDTLGHYLPTNDDTSTLAVREVSSEAPFDEKPTEIGIHLLDSIDTGDTLVATLIT